MQNKKIVILGTGGTIAGRSNTAADNIGYTPGQVSIEQLVQGIPGLSTLDNLVIEQIAQIDSKDISFCTWAYLAKRVLHYLVQENVQGVVITHGTDTLEETAYFLHAVLGQIKPTVLTCAMRPATALCPDGPQNLIDAVTVAMQVNAQGVVAVCAGVVHSAENIQKVHTYRLDPYSSGDAGPIGYVEQNALRLVKNWPAVHGFSTFNAIKNIALLNGGNAWPQVEIVMSYAGANGAVVDGLLAMGVQGLVVAGTGNGTVHHELEAALLKAQAAGVSIVRATRCVNGHVISKTEDAFESSQGLSPVKARIALMLGLLTLHIA